MTQKKLDFSDPTPPRVLLVSTNIYIPSECCYRETCPYCGHSDLDENFDVMGADRGNLFCNACGREFIRGDLH